MKKTISILTGVLCLMACNKVKTPSNNNTLSAVATIDTQTKTVYTDNGTGAGLKVDWADEDSFKAYYSGSSEPIVFSKTEEGASFTAESVPDGVTSATAFTGLYGSKATYDGNINIDFTKQNGTLENIKDFDVMLASSELTDGVLSFAFKHKCAIIRLKVVNKTSSYSVKKVELAFHDSLLDSGFGTTGFTTNTYTAYNSFTFTLANPIAAGKTETVYCVVPAISHKKLIPTDISSAISETTVCASIQIGETKNIEAGKVYDTSVDFTAGYCTNPD